MSAAIACGFLCWLCFTAGMLFGCWWCSRGRSVEIDESDWHDNLRL